MPIRLLSSSALLALAIAVSVAGCVPTPGPSASPTPTPSATASSDPSASPSPEPAALPDCDAIYSAALVASLIAEGREPLGDVSGPGMGGWGTGDATLEGILSAIPERISCTWILPASESGSTTSIARLDDATRTTVVDTLTAAGYTALTVPGGDLYTIEVEFEIGSYNETHLIADDLWFTTYYSGGQSQTLTLDAAAQLLP